MTIRLLALDLDGTLVHDLTGIRPRTVRAVRAALQRGVRVTIATGREFEATEKYARLLDLNTPLICYQGSLIRDHRNGQGELGEALPLDLTYRLIDWARASGASMMVYTPAGRYAERISPLMHELYTKVGLLPTPVDDLRLAVRTPAIKCLIVEAADRAPQVISTLQAAFGHEDVKFFRSYPTIIEAMSKNVSKGGALALLAGRLGVPREAVMAVGDQDNDVEMVAWAGLGVAMGDGSPAVRAAADVIAPPLSEEGAAWAIEQFVLRDPAR